MPPSSPVLRTVWLDGQAQLAGAVTRLAQGDAQAIHDARVATRRLQSCCSCSAPRVAARPPVQRRVGGLTPCHIGVFLREGCWRLKAL